MAFETVHLLRIVELDVHANGTTTLNVYSDLPGNAIALRESHTIDNTGGRRTVRFRLKGTTKGHLFQFELSSLYAIVRLYGGRVYAKPLGGTGDWQWFALPIEPTPEQWTPIAFPIEPTSEEYKPVAFPIEPTSEEYRAIAFPIEPTSEDYKPVRIPIPPTADAQEWQDFPIAP